MKSSTRRRPDMRLYDPSYTRPDILLDGGARHHAYVAHQRSIRTLYSHISSTNACACSTPRAWHMLHTTKSMHESLHASCPRPSRVLTAPDHIWCWWLWRFAAWFQAACCGHITPPPVILLVTLLCRILLGPGLLSGLRSDCKWPVEHATLSYPRFRTVRVASISMGLVAPLP